MKGCRLEQIFAYNLWYSYFQIEWCSAAILNVFILAEEVSGIISLNGCNKVEEMQLSSSQDVENTICSSDDSLANNKVGACSRLCVTFYSTFRLYA